MSAIVVYLSDLNLFAVAGLLGFATYLLAFTALQLGALDGNGPLYAIANVAAAGLVLISLYDAFNLASALIQISWIMIGIVGLLRLRRTQPPKGRYQPA